MRRLDRVARKALRLALSISPDVQVVQVQAEELDTENLGAHSAMDRGAAALAGTWAGDARPTAVATSAVYQRLRGWLHQLAAEHEDRHLLVLIPELVHRRWYQFILSHRATRLKAQLLLDGNPRISVMNTPWYP